jgi:hypothetical protein
MSQATKEAGSKSEVTESRLFVITPKDKTGRNTTELRVVSWNYRQPVIEKRSYWRKNEADSWIWGKNAGLVAEDVIAINNAWTKIEPLLKLKEAADVQLAEEARKAKIAKKSK